MNAINGAMPEPEQPAEQQVASQAPQEPPAIPNITPQWSSSLGQSSDAFTQRTLALADRTRRVHNGANDATDCIRVEVTGTRVEWGTGGRMRMVNTCSYSVAVSWCPNTTDCDRTYGGNLWTIGAGRDWPIFFSDPENPDVRIGACRIPPQAVALPNSPIANINERHLEPHPGSAAGVRSWSRNVCD